MSTIKIVVIVIVIVTDETFNSKCKKKHACFKGNPDKYV